MQGWIKLHRCLLSKPIWNDSTPEQKTILITLMMLANHQGREWEWKGERYKADPGQLVTSLESIAKKCGKGITIQNVRTALKRFEKYEFLTNESTNKNRLITIVNWGFYQGYEEELTSKLTGSQQATNKQLTTNKNVKNDKKNIYAEYVTMTEKEFNKLIEKYGEEPTKKMIEVLDNYKGSKGATYRSDYRAILNWVVEKVQKEEPNKVVQFDSRTKEKIELQKKLQLIAEKMDLTSPHDKKFDELEVEFDRIQEELKKFG